MVSPTGEETGESSSSSSKADPHRFGDEDHDGFEDVSAPQDDDRALLEDDLLSEELQSKLISLFSAPLD